MENTPYARQFSDEEELFINWMRTKAETEHAKLLAILALLEVPPAANKFTAEDFTEAIELLKEQATEETDEFITKAIKWLNKRRKTIINAA